MSEQIPGGYNGKILRVDLTNESIRVETIHEEFCRKYMGGAGFVAHYLLNEVEPQVDALGPANKLIFATGPLTGAPIPGSGRHCIGSKSPLTGGVAKSEVGEFWGRELKRAGFDALIIEGKAARPVYISVGRGQAGIIDAGRVWGKNTKESLEYIKGELADSKVRVALIGQGGENQVRYACIMHGLKNAAGRGGLGAVMGSKNLKAVAVRGDASPPVADRQAAGALRSWLKDNRAMVAGLSAYGTGGAMALYEKIGNLPIRNYRDGTFPAADKIDAHSLKESIRIGMEGCFGCPIRCKKIVEVRGDFEVDSAYGGPEYETLAALGSNCGIDDLRAIAKGNELCNAYSIDTISAGVVISFAMECFEKGLLTAKDTGGIELKFGNAAAMIEMIELIARRRGIGRLLAEGSLRAAEIIGNGAKELCMHVKGLELPMHEPRLNKGLALGYMVNPHGADHCCNIIDIMFAGLGNLSHVTVKEAVSLGLAPALLHDIGPLKVALVRFAQLKSILCDSLVLCQLAPYTSYSCEHLADATKAVTGWDTSPMELLRIAERTLTMLRVFNLRQGLTHRDDMLPGRFFKSPGEGPLANTALDPAKMEQAKKTYYMLMGWDSDGVPYPEKMEELGIV